MALNLLNGFKMYKTILKTLAICVLLGGCFECNFIDEKAEYSGKVKSIYVTFKRGDQVTIVNTDQRTFILDWIQAQPPTDIIIGSDTWIRRTDHCGKYLAVRDNADSKKFILKHYRIEY